MIRRDLSVVQKRATEAMRRDAELTANMVAARFGVSRETAIRWATEAGLSLASQYDSPDYVAPAPRRRRAS